MLSKLPKTKLKSSLKTRFDGASLPQLHSMAWLNYQMFLKRLARLAADNAKQDKSAVIRDSHVRDAAKVEQLRLHIRDVLPDYTQALSKLKTAADYH